MTVNSTTSLIERAGLERPRVAALIDRGLEGADDGELFLEYRQSEALVFDNGRLKQATYDTAQGFGLARGQGRSGRLCALLGCLGSIALARAADAVRAVKGGSFRPLRRCAGPHQCAPLRRRESRSMRPASRPR